MQCLVLNTSYVSRTGDVQQSTITAHASAPCSLLTGPLSAAGGMSSPGPALQAAAASDGSGTTGSMAGGSSAVEQLPMSPGQPQSCQKSSMLRHCPCTRAGIRIRGSCRSCRAGTSYDGYYAATRHGAGGPCPYSFVTQDQAQPQCDANAPATGALAGAWSGSVPAQRPAPCGGA